ncbi:MAG: hypothetical protein CYPHOPRED_005794 [Cyphobasidiales sp. Tagirdzhanova-0007]|nr:MAG: hypothetical protein CYPHOPRED_005794 [Cyphobasidiales sp. Tagirdzhanova-0007]
MPVKLNIVVAGGGLGGFAVSLALAKRVHTVSEYDAAPVFGEAGAGIRVHPNSTRLLFRLGVGLDSMKKSKSSGYHFVSWKDGSTITQFSFGDA